MSPSYLDQLVRVADLPGRHRLRSSSSHRLQVPAYRLATVGRRSFPVAASILWNSLPPDIQSSTSLSVPDRLLPLTKDILFHRSFPDIFCNFASVDLYSVLIYRQVKILILLTNGHVLPCSYRVYKQGANIKIGVYHFEIKKYLYFYLFCRGQLLNNAYSIF